MKDFLKKMIEKRQAQIAELEARNDASDSVEELRSIGKQLTEARAELEEYQKQLTALEAAEENRNQRNPFPTGDESRGADKDEMEYRLAFKEFVQRGTPIPEKFKDTYSFRAEAGTTTSKDVPALLPKVLMNKILSKKDIGAYGQVYNRVRKAALPYGIQFPLTDLTVDGAWVSEGADIPETKAGDAKEYVSFFANLWSGKIARTLIVSIMELDAFEDDLAFRITEAFYKAMDTAIINGSGTGQPLGILKDPRVTKTAKFKAAEIADWKKWNALLWSKIPVSKRGNGILIVGQSTFGTYIQSMADGNNVPLFREYLDGRYDGMTSGRFMGHEVVVVEDDLLGSYDTIGNNANWGIYLPLDDYLVNTPLSFGITQYENPKNHNQIIEGLVVADGKPLETFGTFKLQKDTAL